MEDHKSEERAEDRSGSGSDIREYRGKRNTKTIVSLHKNFVYIIRSNIAKPMFSEIKKSDSLKNGLSWLILCYNKKRSHTCKMSVVSIYYVTNLWRDLSIQPEFTGGGSENYFGANGSHGSVRFRSIPIPKIVSRLFKIRTLDGSLLLVVQLDGNFDFVSDIVRDVSCV